MKNKRAVAGLMVLGALAVTLAAYWPSFKAPFELDDYFVVLTTPVIVQLNDLAAIWRWDPTRFLVYFSFALNFAAGQMDPFGYHAVNFLLHLAAGFLVYGLVKCLIRGASRQSPVASEKIVALFTAGIFLLHPVQTAAVTYIAQRSTLLVAIFYLAAVWGYLCYRQTAKGIFYIGALAAAAAGVFSKPIIVTLPLTLGLIELLFSAGPAAGKAFAGHATQRGSSRSIFPRVTRAGIIAMCGSLGARLGPFVLVVAVVPLLVMSLQIQHAGPGRSLDFSRETMALSRPEYLLTQTHVLWTYLRLLVWPVGQNIDYDYPITHSLDLPTAVLGLGLAGILGLGAWLWKRNRLASFGIFWFFITLSLESSVFPIADVIFEHRLYLPMFGFVFFTAACFSQLVSKSSYKFLLIAILLIFAFLTFHRNLLWSDRINFLRDVAAKSPNKARVHNSLAIAYAEEGAYGPALSALQRAIELDPQDVGGYNNRANIYRITGQIDLAIKEYSFIIDHFPGFAMAYYFRAQCWDAKGEKRKAAADAEMAARMGIR